MIDKRRGAQGEKQGHGQVASDTGSGHPPPWPRINSIKARPPGPAATMLWGGRPLSLARVPPFQRSHMARAGAPGGAAALGQGPALLHMPAVTTVHGFRVLAAGAPLWESAPGAPGQQGERPRLEARPARDSEDATPRPRWTPESSKGGPDLEDADGQPAFPPA